MFSKQRGEIEPDRLTVHDSPFACDHHPVRAMRAAQNQRRQRIMRAREAQFVEPVEREVSPRLETSNLGQEQSGA
jgi:hypothetical protein